MALSREQLVATYGSDYPEAVELNGVRMSLIREGRFLRVYEERQSKMAAFVSRFMDGTAQITLAELKTLWPTWSGRERCDFTSAVSWLRDHPEFADMMRYILDVGEENDFSAVALQVANALPTDEAFERLSSILNQWPAGHAANICQAIARTRHHDAPERLRRRLRATLANPGLMEPVAFVNWIARDAICCMKYLLELGACSSEFEDDVRRLSEHPSDDAIESLRRSLAKWYPWLGGS